MTTSNEQHFIQAIVFSPISTDRWKEATLEKNIEDIRNKYIQWSQGLWITYLCKNRFFYWLNLYDSLLYNLFDDKIDKRLFSLSLQTYQYYKGLQLPAHLVLAFQ